MPIQVGIGFSNHPDVLTAAEEATKQAKQQLGHDRIDVALLFNTAHYQPEEFLPMVFESLNQTKLVGCLTSGIILPQRIESSGIATLLLTSEAMRFETGRISHLNLQNPHGAGKSFVKDCVTGFGQSSRKLLLFFIDGVLDAHPSLFSGIEEELGKDLPIIGAGSSDAINFQKTYQYHSNQILTTSACGLLAGDKFQMGMSCQHGWKPLGKPRKITSAKDNIIHTIDGQKAVNLYENFFHGLASLPRQIRLDRLNLRYPLGIRSPSENKFLLRNVIATLDDGSVVCQDKVSEGEDVHLMLGNQRSCLQAAEQAAYQAREQLAGVKPKLIFVIQSLMRRTLLGRAAIQEIQIIRDILGTDIPLLGLNSLKEFFTPMSADQSLPTDIHNGSLIILTVG